MEQAAYLKHRGILLDKLKAACDAYDRCRVAEIEKDLPVTQSNIQWGRISGLESALGILDKQYPFMLVLDPADPSDPETRK